MRKPKKHYEDYTMPELQEIVRLYYLIPVARIAKRFGRTVGAIHQVARRNGLNKFEHRQTKKAA